MRVPKYVKQILMDTKEETNRNTVTVGDFNTPLTSMVRSPRQKINKGIAALSDTPEKIDLVDNLYPKAAEYI